MKSKFVFPLPAFAVALALLAPVLHGQRARLIKSAVDEGKLVAVEHSVHPSARAERDLGAAADSLPMERMLLVMKRSAAQQADLDQFLAELQQPGSPNYHRFLTPAEFGERFGASDADIQTMTDWLQLNGFHVAPVAAGRSVIEFSGTAGQVKNTFHAEIHRFQMNGGERIANATPQQIPAALADAVAGVATLHNFRRKTQSWLTPDRIPVSNPQYSTSSGNHALAPADFATIYNVQPLYPTITGAGVSIAVVARSNINVSDINSFRSLTGLPANPPNIIVNGTDPGDLGAGEEAEAVLDATWSGAIAKGATVNLVVSASTNTSDGADLSELYIINNKSGTVMTESFSTCEAQATSAEAALVSSNAQQAAAEGITFMVSSGDSGSANCDDFNTETTATGPISVNLLASTPYTVAVGGTQFNESTGTYWSATNGTQNNSALSYIPEDVWNANCSGSSCATGTILSGGGGKSKFFSKPSWQSGVAGIPADGARDIPDVSLTAAGHDPYLLCLAGSCSGSSPHFIGIYGTSASAPSFASIVALINQKANATSGQGQLTPRLYALAAAESLGSCNGSNTSGLPASNCVFNDITIGTNAVPGEANYNTASETYPAGTGYDLATGLGSVNVANLVNNWAGTVGAPSAGVSPSALTFASQTVGSTSTAQTVTLSNAGNAALSIASISITGTNSGSFSQTNNCGSSLAAGSTCAISVKFTPAATGSLSANLVVTDNSGGASGATQSVSLGGTGSSSSGLPTTFTTYLGTYGSGPQTYTGNSALLPVRVYNPGGVSQIANVFTYLLNSSGNADYIVALYSNGSNNYSLYLWDGAYSHSANTTATNTGGTVTLASPLVVGSCQITAYRFAFNGNELQLDVSMILSGTFTEQLTIRSATTAAAYSYPWVVTNGTWSASASSAPGVTLSTSSLNYGSVGVGATQSQSVTVTNSGTAALAISSAQVSGTNASDFVVTANTCTSSVSPGANCSITVSFTPAASGARSATLSITDNASGSPHTVALSGTGTTSALPTTFTTYLGTYGSGPQTYTGNSALLPVRVYNPGGVSQIANVFTYLLNSSGNADYIVALYSNGSNNYSLYLWDGAYSHSANTTATNTGGTVTLASPLVVGSCQITAYRFAFNGNELQLDVSMILSGTFTEQLTIRSATTAAAYSYPWVVTNGTWSSSASSAPGVTLSTSSLNYGSVGVGATQSQSVTVTNSGTAALAISSAQVSGTNASDFVVTANTCTSSVSPGANCSITVSFTPAASGARSATLSITDNASGSPHTVALSGTGSSSSGVPTTFTTYLGTYGSGPQTYTGNSALLPVRVYNPGGVSQIANVFTYLFNSSGSADYIVALYNNGSNNYSLYLWDGAYSHSANTTAAINGGTVTLSSPLVVGSCQITAYRFAFNGNELQLDVSITLSGAGTEQLTIRSATTAAAYSYPWAVTNGTWNY